MIVVLEGSPRKNGNTSRMVEAFLRGVRKGGGEAKRFRLYELGFSGCIACEKCTETGECVMEDDASLVYRDILLASGLLVASPVYFYHLSSRTHAFIERAQPFWVKKFLWKEDFSSPRYGVLFCVGARRDEHLFDGIKRTVKYFFNSLNISFKGGLFIRGVEGPGEITKHSSVLKKAELLGELLSKGVSYEELPLEPL